VSNIADIFQLLFHLKKLADIRLSSPCCYFESSTETQSKFNDKAMSISITPIILNETEQEVQKTCKMLPRISEKKHQCWPHEKCMTMHHADAHMSKLPDWVTTVLATDYFDLPITD
jgi:hypothetical protein